MKNSKNNDTELLFEGFLERLKEDNPIQKTIDHLIAVNTKPVELHLSKNKVSYSSEDFLMNEPPFVGPAKEV